MKLIDLLVKELPKRGGWPEGVDSIHQDHDGEIYAWTGSSAKLLFRTSIIADNCRPYGLDESIENMVTRNQYKSVFSLSQKPAWSGEGVPLVGCECEYLDNNGKWYPVTIKYASDQLVVISGLTKILDVEQSTEIAKDIITDKPQFRPLRTEADRKRDEAVEAIDFYMPEFITDTPNEFYHAKKIYDAIAAGKIPGVKLDD